MAVTETADDYQRLKNLAQNMLGVSKIIKGWQKFSTKSRCLGPGFASLMFTR